MPSFALVSHVSLVPSVYIRHFLTPQTLNEKEIPYDVCTSEDDRWLPSTLSQRTGLAEMVSFHLID